MQLKTVRVRWDDSAAFGGWSHGDEARGFAPAQCESVGFLVAEHKDRIIIALSRSAVNDRFGEVVVIPRKSLLSMKVV